MTLTRIIVAAIWIPLHLAIIYFGRPVHFMIYIQIFAVLIALELFSIMGAKGLNPHRLLVLLSGAAIVFFAWFDPRWAILTVVVFMLLNLGALVFRKKPENAMPDASVSIFALFYVPVLLAFTVMIRGLPFGAYYLMILFLGIWAYDTAAYFSGKTLGKHKLAPKISPKKSIEGLVGGTAFVFIVVPIMTHLFWPVIGLKLWQSLLVALIIVAAATVGDLIESVLKRDAVVKDSGGFLPGHGGMLDRFDGVLYAAPIMYFFFVLISGISLFGCY
ncbi:MAG: phosphatidate cytidylyltransferase [bacterium]|nr:phosphatidate cytidylyltransferase [bacterium]